MVRWPDARPCNTEDIDVRRPSSARMFDFFMGGSANFEIDREAGQEVVEAMPEVVQSIHANRGFLARAVRFLSGQGIEQFLDLGSRVPTVGSAHEIAHSLDPAARVIYVDREPVAVAHSRQVLDDVKQAEIVEADFRDVRSVLSGAAATGLIDFARPLGLLMISALNFVEDDELAADVVRRYAEALVPGSYLVLSHSTAAGFPQETAERVAEVYRNVNPPSFWRSPDEILALLRGTTLVPPGLVAPSHWRPDREPEVDPNRVAFRAGVAEIGR
ncbi:SAM-dependent methyltransferase [Saccharopolyspora sp. NFXS83]|uniref:SAM-dependent methyltransferase n=1 Tax=Saccharopolyspora sp. NFXS83 TaxID=2993560 RepID=UPI00224A8A4F|nr:SAM-dependent methyltransferase [Saccharopolyspora sp. NFXS83]MCX2732726.1 SAM-dependent methyltransferase [Saccharopolyspora sp. NFXS83]